MTKEGDKKVVTLPFLFSRQFIPEITTVSIYATNCSNTAFEGHQKRKVRAEHTRFRKRALYLQKVIEYGYVYY